jgi:hypothetical protein
MEDALMEMEEDNGILIGIEPGFGHVLPRGSVKNLSSIN